jgi:hypothetical protein
MLRRFAPWISHAELMSAISGNSDHHFRLIRASVLDLNVSIVDIFMGQDQIAMTLSQK